MDEDRFIRSVFEACRHVKVSKTAKETLAKDLLLLFYGLRSAVLIDYLPLKSIYQVTESCLVNVRQLHEDFAVVCILHLCEDNFFLIHVQHALKRLRCHVEEGLVAVAMVNCSKGSPQPYLMEEYEKMQVLSTFSALVEKMEQGINALGPGATKIEMEDESFAMLLPTIAGWILEYPVVYFVDDIMSGNSLGLVPLHLYRLEVRSDTVS
eukprot:768489-Hanusia_phi.AAC.1